MYGAQHWLEGVLLREVSDKRSDLAKRCRNAMDRGMPITVFVAGADRPIAVTGFIQAVVIDNVANNFDITILEE